jgi:hypothetical protein
VKENERLEADLKSAENEVETMKKKAERPLKHIKIEEDEKSATETSSGVKAEGVTLLEFTRLVQLLILLNTH